MNSIPLDERIKVLQCENAALKAELKNIKNEIGAVEMKSPNLPEWALKKAAHIYMLNANAAKDLIPNAAICIGIENIAQALVKSVEDEQRAIHRVGKGLIFKDVVTTDQHPIQFYDGYNEGINDFMEAIRKRFEAQAICERGKEME